MEKYIYTPGYIEITELTEYKYTSVERFVDGVAWACVDGAEILPVGDMSMARSLFCQGTTHFFIFRAQKKEMATVCFEHKLGLLTIKPKQCSNVNMTTLRRLTRSICMS